MEGGKIVGEKVGGKVEERMGVEIGGKMGGGKLGERMAGGKMGGEREEKTGGEKGLRGRELARLGWMLGSELGVGSKGCERKGQRIVVDCEPT